MKTTSGQFSKTTESWASRFATPLTMGLFLVSMTSGVALFFHWLPGTFHLMHQRLSMVLLIAFGMHAWKNRRALLDYGRRGGSVVAVLICVVAALPFTTSRGGVDGLGNPRMRAINLMTHSRIADLAPILKVSPDVLVATLRENGYPVRSAEDSLADLTADTGEAPTEALVAILPNIQRPAPAR